MISFSFVWVKVGNSEEGISWFVQITDLHISKYYSPDRTSQLRQLGEWKVDNKMGVELLHVFPYWRADQYRQTSYWYVLSHISNFPFYPPPSRVWSGQAGRPGSGLGYRRLDRCQVSGLLWVRTIPRGVADLLWHCLNLHQPVSSCLAWYPGQSWYLWCATHSP